MGRYIFTEERKDHEENLFDIRANGCLKVGKQKEATEEDDFTTEARGHGVWELHPDFRENSKNKFSENSVVSASLW
jgi:hypothetical protein